jgi:hypothetical protein
MTHESFVIDLAADGNVTCALHPVETSTENLYATSHDATGSFALAGWLPGSFSETEAHASGTLTAADGPNTTETSIRFTLPRAP